MKWTIIGVPFVLDHIVFRFKKEVLNFLLCISEGRCRTWKWSSLSLFLSSANIQRKTQAAARRRWWVTFSCRRKQRDMILAERLSSPDSPLPFHLLLYCMYCDKTITMCCASRCTISFTYTVYMQPHALMIVIITQAHPVLMKGYFHGKQADYSRSCAIYTWYFARCYKAAVCFLHFISAIRTIHIAK